jgi:hypothetical protein
MGNLTPFSGVLPEEEMELPAGRIEGSLLQFL